LALAAATAEVSQVTVQAYCFQVLDRMCNVKQADLGCTVGWTKRIKCCCYHVWSWKRNRTGRKEWELKTSSSYRWWQETGRKWNETCGEETNAK